MRLAQQKNSTKQSSTMEDAQQNNVLKIGGTQIHLKINVFLQVWWVYIRFIPKKKQNAISSPLGLHIFKTTGDPKPKPTTTNSLSRGPTGGGYGGSPHLGSG